MRLIFDVFFIAIRGKQKHKAEDCETLTTHVWHHKHRQQAKKKKNFPQSRLSVSTLFFEQVNTAAGSLAASASEKQEEGTAAETHQVQPAVALQMAWSAIASQAPLVAVSTETATNGATGAAPAARAEPAIKQHRSNTEITARAMVGRVVRS